MGPQHSPPALWGAPQPKRRSCAPRLAQPCGRHGPPGKEGMAAQQRGRSRGHRWRRGDRGQEGPCRAPGGLRRWGRGWDGAKAAALGCRAAPGGPQLRGEPPGRGEGGAAALQGDSMALGASWLGMLNPAPPPPRTPTRPPPAPFTLLSPSPAAPQLFAPSPPICPHPIHPPAPPSPAAASGRGPGWSPLLRPRGWLCSCTGGGSFSPSPEARLRRPHGRGSPGHGAGAVLGAPQIPTRGPRLRPGPQPPEKR